MKTAVEWLVEQINPYGLSVHQDLFEQAKEMEQEQMAEMYRKAIEKYDPMYGKSFKSE